MYILGKISYDKQIFETVKSENINLFGEWVGLVYNEETGNFIVERKTPTASSEKILTIVLKTKKNIEDSNFEKTFNIDICDNVVSGGEKDINLANGNFSIKLQKADYTKTEIVTLPEAEKKDELAPIEIILPATGEILKNSLKIMVAIAIIVITIISILLERKNKKYKGKF